MRLILFTIIAIQFISCLRNTEARKVEIAWTGGTDLSSITISIDSVKIEAGPEAYIAFIRHLESVPDGSRLHFSYPFSFVVKNYEQSGGMDPLPFNGDEDSHKTFADTCLRKRLSYSMEPK